MLSAGLCGPPLTPARDLRVPPSKRDLVSSHSCSKGGGGSSPGRNQINQLAGGLAQSGRGPPKSLQTKKRPQQWRPHESPGRARTGPAVVCPGGVTSIPTQPPPLGDCESGGAPTGQGPYLSSLQGARPQASGPHSRSSQTRPCPVWASPRCRVGAGPANGVRSEKMGIPQWMGRPHFQGNADSSKQSEQHPRLRPRIAMGAS